MRSKRSPIKATPEDFPVATGRLLTPIEAAERCGVGKTKLLELVRSRRLPCRMLDGRIRITESELAAFIAALPNGYAKQPIPKKLRHPSTAPLR
jgi:excisionase family DNA binding protein